MACLIDNVLTSLVIMPVLLGTTVFGDFKHPENRDALTGVEIVVFAVIVFLAINGWLLVTYAQTVGKRVVGIGIVNLDGTRTDFAVILLRRLLPVWIVSAVPGLSLLGIANPLFIFRADRRCLHDHLAGTKVVQVRAPAPDRR
jgi:uncharacterized RDD family membrane protein YckC